MRKIKLPGYRTIVPNEVYGKSAESLDHPTRGKISATQIMELIRFRAPTQDEVINFIITNAEGIDLYSLENDKPSEKDPEITYVLKSLSRLLDISRENKNLLNDLRNCFPIVDLQDGRVYFNAFNRIVPNHVLDSGKKLVFKEGTEAYNMATRESVREWRLIIRLLEDGKFPNSLELEYLIDRGVTRSDVFSAKGDFGNYQNVADQIRLFNNVFGSTRLFSQIVDKSPQMLEDIAASIVRKTIVRITYGKNIIMDELDAILGQGSEDRSLN